MTLSQSLVSETFLGRKSALSQCESSQSGYLNTSQSDASSRYKPGDMSFDDALSSNYKNVDACNARSDQLSEITATDSIMDDSFQEQDIEEDLLSEAEYVVQEQPSQSLNSTNGLAGLRPQIQTSSFKSVQQQKILSLNFMNRLMNLIDDYIQKKRISLRRPSATDDVSDLEQLLERIQYTDESIAEMRLQQVLCCKQEMRAKGKVLFCTVCGQQSSMNKKTNRIDRNENSSKNTSYQAIKHFDTVIKYMFMQQSEDIPSSVRDELRQFMERDQKQKVTIEDVRQYLKQLTKGKGSKLNKLDAAILQQLNGDQPVKLSTKEFNFIRDVYYQTVQIFYLNNVERNNTPSASYLIKCIIELLYKDYDPKRFAQLSKLIHIQKEQTVLKIQKRWQSIIKQLDVPTIKKQFRSVMEDQRS